jgi:hypothetical protein
MTAPHPKTPPIIFFKNSALAECTVILLLLSLLFILRFDAFLWVSERYLGGYEHDAGLYVWLVHYNAGEITKWLHFLFGSTPTPDLWFNTQAFYPYGASLAWSDCFLFPSALFLSFVTLGLPDVVAYNVLILGANFLNGYCTYRLAVRLTGHISGAFISGALFMCASYFGGMLGHPQLQFAFWIPLTLLVFFKLLAHPAPFRAMVLALALIATFATTVYYAVFTALLLFATLCALTLLRVPVVSRRSFVYLVLSAIIFTVIGYPLFAPYLAVQTSFGSRALYEPYFFALNLLSFFSASAFNWLYGSTSKIATPEGQLFNGVLPLLLAGFAIAKFLSAREIRSRLLVTSVCTLLTLLFATFIDVAGFAIGAALLAWATLIFAGITLFHVGKKERARGFSTLTRRDWGFILLWNLIFFIVLGLGPLGTGADGSLALGPHRLFFDIFPGVSAIRAISRVGVVTMLCLALLSGLAINILRETRRLSPWGLSLILFGIVIENYQATYPIEGEIPPSPVFHYLAQLPNQEDAVIALPFAGELTAHGTPKSWTQFSRFHVNVMNWSRVHQRPIVNGYSGQRTKLIRDFPRALQNFPDRHAVRALSTLAGLRYILIVSRFIPNFDRILFLERLERYPELKLILDDDEGNLLLEFRPEIDLREVEGDRNPFQLWLPSNRNHIAYLAFELFAPAYPSLQKIVVTIEDSLTHEVLSEIPLTPDALWNQFKVELPTTKEWVRPRIVTFKLTPHPLNRYESVEKHAIKVRLRNTHFEVWR